MLYLITVISIMFTAYHMHLYMKAKYGGHNDTFTVVKAQQEPEAPTCLGITKQNQRCQLYPGDNNQFCHIHSKTKTPPKICLGTTRQGRKCKKHPHSNNDFCHLHS